MNSAVIAVMAKDGCRFIGDYYQNSGSGNMVCGRGGMGSHKHGVSGHAGHSPRFKHDTELELRREEKLQTKKKLGLSAATVAEAMQHAKSR